MKLVALALLGALALSSPGCASPPIGVAAVQQSTVDDRAVAVALAAYDATTHAYTAAVVAGRLPRSTVAQIKPLRLRAAAVRKAVVSAYRAGNAATLSAELSELKQLTGQLKALSGG